MHGTVPCIYMEHQPTGGHTSINFSGEKPRTCRWNWNFRREDRAIHLEVEISCGDCNPFWATELSLTL